MSRFEIVKQNTAEVQVYDEKTEENYIFAKGDLPDFIELDEDNTALLKEPEYIQFEEIEKAEAAS